jgi:hypothetical protein
MRPLPSIRHRIAPLRPGSLSAGSAPACILAPDPPPAPSQIRARNTQLAHPKSKSRNFFDPKPRAPVTLAEE